MIIAIVVLIQSLVILGLLRNSYKNRKTVLRLINKINELENKKT